MGCPLCGCRLVSKQAASLSEVICSDCGHPMKGHLRSLSPQMRWGDQGLARASSSASSRAVSGIAAPLLSASCRGFR
jgi:transcription initiation factor TFIIIB Brf1 subunit/transcription initiation factor TFIIB